MSLFECKKVHNCFISKFSYQYRMQDKIKDDFVSWLETISSEFNCRRDFPRPYFKATLSDQTKVQGVIGDTAVKAIFPNESPEANKERFEQLLQAHLEAVAKNAQGA